MLPKPIAVMAPHANKLLEAKTIMANEYPKTAAGN